MCEQIRKDSEMKTEVDGNKSIVMSTVQKQVRQLIGKKLERYFNLSKREDLFDSSGRGIYATSAKMGKYDLAYHILERTELENKARIRKQANTKKKESVVEPKVMINSRRMVLNGEADRLTSYASEVLVTTPVENLNRIHRYRPHTNVRLKTSTGKVQNYSRNVHAVLHSQKYVDYYQNQGLDRGNVGLKLKMQESQTSSEPQDDSQLSNDPVTPAVDDDHVHEAGRHEEPRDQKLLDVINDYNEDELYYSDHGENTLSDGDSEAEYLYTGRDDSDVEREISKITMNEDEESYTEQSRSCASRLSRPGAAKSHFIDRQVTSSACTTPQSEKSKVISISTETKDHDETHEGECADEMYADDFETGENLTEPATGH